MLNKKKTNFVTLSLCEHFTRIRKTKSTITVTKDQVNALIEVQSVQKTPNTYLLEFYILQTSSVKPTSKKLTKKSKETNFLCNPIFLTVY